MDTLMDTLIVVAGIALVSHVALCVVLQRRLREHEDVLKELFAIPNSRLSEGVGVRLLRVRYYLPWAKSGLDSSRIDAVSRTVLVAARVTGLVVPIALLAFLATPFLQASV
jgi:hypothetical protein